MWVWLGDPALADAARIPDMQQMTDPAWAGDGMTIHARCNYQLVLDNLMDLTTAAAQHVEHRPEAQRVRVRDDPHRHDRYHRRALDAGHRCTAVLVEEHARQVLATGKVDRWQIIHYEAPSTICIDVGVARRERARPRAIAARV